MTTELRDHLNSLFTRFASSGQTGEFLRQVIEHLNNQKTDTLSYSDAEAIVRVEAARVCDDEAHINHALQNLSELSTLTD